MTDGQKLENYIKENLGGIESFAAEIGKNKSYLYYNLRKDPLSDSIKRFLQKSGLDVKKVLEIPDPLSEARKGMIEYPVVLSSEKKAYIQLPISHTDADLEKIARVLLAYRKKSK